jgi:hypothetical protein
LGAEETVTDLSEGKGGFQGIVGQSEDLSSVYFVDTAVLTEENEREEVPRPGQDNLYLHHGATTSFIATLPPKDNEYSGFLIEVGDWHPSAAFRTAEASPDGRYLAFLSRSSLTGFENTTAGNASGEVFLYDSATRKLTCPSCNPAGAPSLGGSRLPLDDPIATDYQTQTRYLLDSGRLYFDTQESLVASDANEGAEDVYEFEPQGVGSCERPAGCVLLISAGREASDSNFFAVDESGKNVFFTTRGQLVPKDKDDLIDLYDAREEGGIAAETELAQTGCQGEACQATPTPPLFATPGSSAFSGAGNLLQPPPTSSPVKPKKVIANSGALAKKLRVCRRKTSKRKRVACEKQARKTTHRPRKAQNVKKGGKR